jgi:hypothetical protein
MKNGLAVTVVGLVLGSLLIWAAAPSGVQPTPENAEEFPGLYLQGPRNVGDIRDPGGASADSVNSTRRDGFRGFRTVLGTDTREQTRIVGTNQETRNTRGDVPNGWDASKGKGTVGDGAVLFLGEADVAFDGGLAGASTLFGTDGDADGGVVSVDPADVEVTEANGFTTGRYTTTGESSGPGIAVREARIVGVDIENERGVGVAGGNVRHDERLTVTATWNYFPAEDLELRITDRDDDVEVTHAVLMPNNSSVVGYGTTGVGNQFQPGSERGQATWVIDMSDQEAGTYSFEFEAIDDLDHASDSTTLTLTTEASPSIDLESTEAVQGETVAFEIVDSSAGETHIVTIERPDMRDGVLDRRALPPTGDGIRYGQDQDGAFVWTEYRINADTGVATGQVDTGYLDSTRVVLQLYAADRDLEDVRSSPGDVEAEAVLTVRENETEARSTTTDSGSEEEQQIDDTSTTAPPQHTDSSTSSPTSTPNGTPISRIGGFGLVGLTIGFLLGTFGNKELRLSVIAIFGGLFSGQFFDLIPENVSPGVILGAIAAGVIVGVVLGTLFKARIPDESN